MLLVSTVAADQDRAIQWNGGWLTGAGTNYFCFSGFLENCYGQVAREDYRSAHWAFIAQCRTPEYVTRAFQKGADQTDHVLDDCRLHGPVPNCAGTNFIGCPTLNPTEKAAADAWAQKLASHSRHEILATEVLGLKYPDSAGSLDK